MHQMGVPFVIFVLAGSAGNSEGPFNKPRRQWRSCSLCFHEVSEESVFRGREREAVSSRCSPSLAAL